MDDPLLPKARPTRLQDPPFPSSTPRQLEKPRPSEPGGPQLDLSVSHPILQMGKLRSTEQNRCRKCPQREGGWAKTNT